jgi:hypothetical protein
MITESREEKPLASTAKDDLRCEIEVLRTTLENAFTEYETNKELIRNPSLWISHIENALHRADGIFALRKQYPPLEDIFAKLEVSYHRAERRMVPYAKKWLPAQR